LKRFWIFPVLVAVLVTITFFLGRNPVKTIDESGRAAMHLRQISVPA